MPSKKHKPEEIIGKLREAEIVLAQGASTAEACRRIAISEQTCYRWRKEGLKVPQKQPKRGRLWWNDGSCIRLRPEYPGHVWAYDFVEGRTPDGRKFRILTIIDETSRECLALIGVTTFYIAPGSPWENGDNVSFNGSLRDELRGWRDLLKPHRGPRADRSLAAALQHRPSA